LCGCLWLLRRRGLAQMLPGRRRAERNLESLERLPLSPQHTLHLVRIRDAELLLALTPAGCTVVEKPSPKEHTR